VLPGGGVSVKKIPLGVTVRKIEFIDDATVSSPEHPLYALLISRELEGNQSQLNDDGISLEEKRRSHEEKEAVKARRQVEADLGGFDVEQEWVEEIERDDCFHIDMNVGGAPPIPKTSYALWIVDASNDWSVIDSYELDEYEHGMAMKVMTLTDVSGIRMTA
jgi:cleavage and polyadenylation specificity factor subunit 1